ncbi:S8 family serine peptidase [Aeromonas simiae]|uniref:S8 family serine peptidase n=3 Tax=Aeromonas simiae TaxID=218936 RepID=UPI00266D278E|nr:S8 family serine peptidase [Aeromonas simiae]MDO2947545.1 S8 family serine peptidase [Aeromonas simiae]MDO2955105.1 S8 family serine peptidase [Aeromonas simiae]
MRIVFQATKSISQDDIHTYHLNKEINEETYLKLLKHKDKALHPEQYQQHVDNLNLLYSVEVAEGEDIDVLKSSLNQHLPIKKLYVERHYKENNIDPVETEETRASDPTTNPYFLGQVYLRDDALGVNAEYSYTRTGGSGEQIRLVLIDGGINPHEDLENRDITFINNESNGSDHGTHCMSIAGAEDNNIGIIGVSPKSDLYFGSVEGKDVWTNVIDYISPGDVIFSPRQNEYRPLITNATRRAEFRILTAYGAIIVIIAGNSAENLDEYQDGDGRYILNRNSDDFEETGVIIAGGCNADAKRTRRYNYGSCIDAFALAHRVLLAQGDVDPHHYGILNGTSYACPIIAGVCGNIQSFLKAHGKAPLDSAGMRELFLDEALNKKGEREDTAMMPDLKLILKHLDATYL